MAGPYVFILMNIISRYFQDTDVVSRGEKEKYRQQIHSAIADYFIGKWSGQKKPFRYSETLAKRLSVKEASDADRKIPRQPLKWKTESATGIQVNITYFNFSKPLILQ